MTAGVDRLLSAVKGLLRNRHTVPEEGGVAEDRLLRLEAITETALSHLDLEELLDELLERIRDLLDADTAVMLLVEEERDVLIPKATKGLDAELEFPVAIPIGQGFAGRVAATRSTVVIDEVATAEIVNPVLREAGVRSLIGVPLLHLGKLIGVVHAGAYRPAYFSHDDGLLLQLVADRVALAITQSRLYEAEREARRDAETAYAQVAFLARASELLGSSLEYESTLEQLAQLAVPALADEVLIDMVAEEGGLKRLATAHADPGMLALIRSIEQRYPPNEEPRYGAGSVVGSGEAQLVPEMTDEVVGQIARDEEHRRLIEELGIRSFMTVPLVARRGILGAITFIASSDRRFGPGDLAFAEELARRAATAIENAQLHAETEERAQASLVLDHVGEGVFLVDGRGFVHLWNPAAEAITGIPTAEIVGQPAGRRIPGWSAIDDLVPVASSASPADVRPETLPLDLGDREIWILISGVSFPDGTVYAFRDMTEERRLRDLQSDFVATISHELRTPLAAVYGAAMTLQQRSELSEEQRARLLAVVYDEAARLGRIIDDVLWVSRLDSGEVAFAIEECDPRSIAESVVEAASVSLPATLSLELEAKPDVTSLAIDPDKMRQVLSNLVDNAVKYSPDGGRIRVTIVPNGRYLRFGVEDEGLGIPAGEQQRIFEKFYRVDPNLTRGVGGTGLGLYVSSELVRRMEGRIWVESREGEGSRFYVDLPLDENRGPDEVLAHLS
jgi:signal transduction histidine kinase/putative methionine-R-sulfoxide reductase with GAF domain